MAFQDILVHVRPYGSIEPVEVALRLGGRFDARVTGLYALEDVARFRRILTENSAPLQGLIERDYAAAAQAEQRIRALAQSAGVDFDWQACEGDPADLIAIVSRLQDLVVVGKTEPDESWGVIERMVTVPTGRPVLVVPSTGPFLDTGKCVLIAWNGSAQAADAVIRGMPLLAEAERVVVLTGSEERERLPGATPPAAARRCGISETPWYRGGGAANRCRGCRRRNGNPRCGARRHGGPCRDGSVRPFPSPRMGPRRGHAHRARLHGYPRAYGALNRGYRSGDRDAAGASTEPHCPRSGGQEV